MVAGTEARSAALKLYGWLIRQRDYTTTGTAILRIGPKSLRSQSRRDTALAVLEQAGLVQSLMHDRWCACEVDL